MVIISSRSPVVVLPDQKLAMHFDNLPEARGNQHVFQTIQYYAEINGNSKSSIQCAESSIICNILVAIKPTPPK